MKRFGNVYILFVTVLVLLLFFQTSAAQDLTLVTPREAGLSARKLAKVDKLIKKNMIPFGKCHLRFSKKSKNIIHWLKRYLPLV